MQILVMVVVIVEVEVIVDTDIDTIARSIARYVIISIESPNRGICNGNCRVVKNVGCG